MSSGWQREEAAMRPGYERVRTDTRRAPIPDLPLPEEEGAQQEVANDVERAILVLSAVFVVMLLFAIVTGFYTARTSHQSGATTHLSDSSLH
jgi:hypothetical protein